MLRCSHNPDNRISKKFRPLKSEESSSILQCIDMISNIYDKFILFSWTSSLAHKNHRNGRCIAPSSGSLNSNFPFCLFSVFGFFFPVQYIHSSVVRSHYIHMAPIALSYDFGRTIRCLWNLICAQGQLLSMYYILFLQIIKALWFLY